MISRTFLRVSLVIAAVTAGASCAHQQTTGPSNNPIISSVTPRQFLVGDAPQLVSITGVNFGAAPSLSIARPSGLVVEILTGQLDSFSNSTLQARIRFDEPGPFRVAVRNQTGETSNEADLVVQGAIASPVIMSVNPPTPIRSTLLQNLMVSGVDFVDGLAVTIVDPDGIRVTAGLIGAVQQTQFQLQLALSKHGIYTISVMNPDGTFSNTLTFGVN